MSQSLLRYTLLERDWTSIVMSNFVSQRFRNESNILYNTILS